MKWHRCTSVMAGLMLVLTPSAARASVFNMRSGLTSLDFVTVDSPGNDADTRYDATGYGGVDHVYQIGKYEVTAGQYTAFLNAAAKTDTYGLHSTNMTGTYYGCKIERSGPSGSYSYSVAADYADRPVNYVSWGDAARFMNWLHNGQPTGEQGPGTTETGAYTLNGATSHDELMAITRNSDAKYWIPTENEWYKAAYHKEDGATGNYFDYPTSSDNKPSNGLTNPGLDNNANFYLGGDALYMTEVGKFVNSASPYGTFGQAGNVSEWNETETNNGRGVRGGSWSCMNPKMLASYDYPGNGPTAETGSYGFRVATNEVIPEPASIVVWCGLCVTGLLWWKRRK